MFSSLDKNKNRTEVGEREREKEREEELLHQFIIQFVIALSLVPLVND